MEASIIENFCKKNAVRCMIEHANFKVTDLLSEISESRRISEIKDKVPQELFTELSDHLDLCTEFEQMVVIMHLQGMAIVPGINLKIRNHVMKINTITYEKDKSSVLVWKLYMTRMNVFHETKVAID